MSPTERQMALLRYLYGYQLAHGGVSPTVRECARALGLDHKSNAHRLLVALEERGLLRRLPGRPRAIEILHPPAIPTIDGAPLYAVPLRAAER